MGHRDGPSQAIIPHFVGRSGPNHQMIRRARGSWRGLVQAGAMTPAEMVVATGHPVEHRGSDTLVADPSGTHLLLTASAAS